MIGRLLFRSFFSLVDEVWRGAFGLSHMTLGKLENGFAAKKTNVLTSASIDIARVPELFLILQPTFS